LDDGKLPSKAPVQVGKFSLEGWFDSGVEYISFVSIRNKEPQPPSHAAPRKNAKAVIPHGTLKNSTHD